MARINTNQNIFITIAGRDILVENIFIDDIKILAPKNYHTIVQVKSKLARAFYILDIRPIGFYLGLKKACDGGKQTIKLSQPAYFDKVFGRFHFDKTNTITTLIKEIAIFWINITCKSLSVVSLNIRISNNLVLSTTILIPILLCVSFFLCAICIYLI